MNCGTTSGYDAHRRKGEPTCQACRDARTAYRKALEADKKPCTYEECGRPTRARGLCGGHLSRIYRRGSLELPSDRQKFWERVEEGPATTSALGKCWLWTGALSSRGYGNFNPGRGRWASAHRWAYEELRHEIPTGLQIDHLCRVTRCVNPWHMEPVTTQENLRREHLARRAS